MTRSLEEIDRELLDLRERVDALTRQRETLEHPFRQTAGCFTGDEDLRRIAAKIEAQRSIPDPGFPDDLDNGAGGLQIQTVTVR